MGRPLLSVPVVRAIVVGHDLYPEVIMSRGIVMSRGRG